VTFSSSATNLAPQGPFNDFNHVFVRDRQTGAVEQVSVDSQGNPGGFDSGGFTDPAAVTPDGRYVAFSAFTGTLVPGDTNRLVDVFLRDRHGGTTVRVSVASDGTQANGGSAVAGVSADGRYVFFNSRATNLVPVDANGLRTDVFVHDMLTGTTTLVSVRKDGSQVDQDTRAWDVSNDGRYVLFDSLARYNPKDNGQVNGFVKDLRTGTVEPVTVEGSGREFASGTNFQPLSMSADGRMVAFEAAPPGRNYQVYVRDRQLRKTTLATVNLDGKPANFGSSSASVSANGRYRLQHRRGEPGQAGRPAVFQHLCAGPRHEDDGSGDRHGYRRGDPAVDHRAGDVRRRRRVRIVRAGRRARQPGRDRAGVLPVQLIPDGGWGPAGGGPAGPRT
jgi:Tol biopolymer transport system component